MLLAFAGHRPAICQGPHSAQDSPPKEGSSPECQGEMPRRLRGKCVYAYVHTCMCVCVSMCACVRACVHTWVCMCEHVSGVRVGACAHVCVYVRVCGCVGTRGPLAGCHESGFRGLDAGLRGTP